MYLRAISAPNRDMWREFRPAFWTGLVAASGQPPRGVFAWANSPWPGQGGCPQGDQPRAAPNILWSRPERLWSQTGCTHLEQAAAASYLCYCWPSCGRSIVCVEWWGWAVGTPTTCTPGAALLGPLLPRPHLSPELMLEGLKQIYLLKLNMKFPKTYVLKYLSWE